MIWKDIYPIVGNTWVHNQSGSKITGAYDIRRICAAYATACDICRMCLLRICHMPHMRFIMSMQWCELLWICWNWLGRSDLVRTGWICVELMGTDWNLWDLVGIDRNWLDPVGNCLNLLELSTCRTDLNLLKLVKTFGWNCAETTENGLTLVDLVGIGWGWLELAGAAGTK